MTKNPGFPLRDSTGALWSDAKPKPTLKPIEYGKPSVQDVPKPFDGQDIAIKAGAFMFVVLFGFVLASFA